MLVLNFMDITLLVPDLYRTNLEGGISLTMHASRPPFKWELIINVHACLLPYEDSHIVIKRLLQYIFHIDPGISPRLQYQARQWSWRTDMGRGLIPRTIWKVHVIIYLSHILHWLFSSIDLYMAENILELTNCEDKSLTELPFFNLQIFSFRVLYIDVIKFV